MKTALCARMFANRLRKKSIDDQLREYREWGALHGILAKGSRRRDDEVTVVANITLTPGTGGAQLIAQPARLFVTGDLILDPIGPFYVYMLAFLAASAGLTAVYDTANYPIFMHGSAGIFPAKVVVGAKVNLTECVEGVRNGALPQQTTEISLCSMLANTAYESLPERDRRRLKGNPVFEVFRHVRHATSHGNRWHFIGKYKEPTARGEWQGFLIDEAHKGKKNPLHDKQCIHNSLLPGDLLFLLRDVEKLL
jgi:hypothetical protein